MDMAATASKMRMTGMANLSAPARARITGIVYLLFFVTAIAGAIVMPVAGGPGGPSGDAASIAKSIMTHQSAYKAGVALGLFSTAIYVALSGLFYWFFRPVSRTLSLLAALFSVVGCAVGALGNLFLLAPLEILRGSSYAKVFTADQLQSLVLLFINLNTQANHVALVFFGSFQLVLGYLIFKSTFLPRAIGVLIAIAGVGWLTFMVPPISSALLVYLEILGIVAEGLLMLWLLVLGVNGRRWAQLAGQP